MNRIADQAEFAARGVRRWETDAGIFDRIPKPGLEELAHVPGKRGLPVLGILPEALIDPMAFGRRMHARYGRVYRFYASGSWNVQLIGPEANELVLFDKDNIFSAWGGWSPVIEPFFPGALLIQDGQRHRANRRILGEAFRQSKLTGYQQIFERDIAAAVASWQGRTIDVYSEVRRLTMRIAASTFLGISMGEEAEAATGAFAEMMGGLLALSHNPWLSRAAARGYRSKKALEAQIGELIARKRAEGGEDMLARLCQLEGDDGRGLSDGEIADNIIFLLAAAHDTLASAFTSVIHFLSRETGWTERLREELEGARLASPAEAATAALPLQDMCFKESIRLNAPAPIVWRRATAPYSIYGYDLPAGTITGVLPMLVHRDPDIWERPDEFDPMRFTPEAEARRHKHAYVPFGSGLHKCLGLHFAQQQARIFLTHLVSSVELEPVGKRKVGWYNWPNCRPRGRLQVRVSAALR
jgi:cytochrome P450